MFRPYLQFEIVVFKLNKTAFDNKYLIAWEGWYV